jgi:hypothetical protein
MATLECGRYRAQDSGNASNIVHKTDRAPRGGGGGLGGRSLPFESSLTEHLPADPEQRSESAASEPALAAPPSRAAPALGNGPLLRRGALAERAPRDAAGGDTGRCTAVALPLRGKVSLLT